MFLSNALEKCDMAETSEKNQRAATVEMVVLLPAQKDGAKFHLMR